jgi:hypothetical protein
MFKPRNLFSAVFALVFLACLPSARAGNGFPRGVVVPPIDCGDLLESTAALGAHYGQFRAYLEVGYENLERLTPGERAGITGLENELATLPPATSTAGLRARLASFPGLSAGERRKVAAILGLNEATLGAALEKYRANYQYVFWSDHSVRHMLEVIERSRELSVSSPPAFLAYFAPALENPQWQTRIDRAIRLHDSRMAVSRAEHAEALLDWDDATFPAHWSEEAKAAASILAMLHSKSTVPYAELPRWRSVVTEEILPKLLRAGMIGEEKATLIRTAIGKIDAETMAKAAAWLRIADAARPIGGELRNSAGDSFVLSDDARAVFLRTAKGDLPVPRSQFAADYGQLALGNFRIRSARGGRFKIIFPFRIKGAFGGSLRRELARFDAIGGLLAGTAEEDLKALRLGPEANAVAGILTSILGDFPPELLKKMELELK